MSKIPRGRLRRLGKLVSVTARVGSDLVGGRVKQLLGGEDSTAVEAARKLVSTLGEMKGMALKLGQSLTLAASELPPEVRAVLGRFFSQAPSLPYEDIARVVEEQLGKRPEVLFRDFSPEPIAAASLGQVHGARLADGTEIVVKVQYPGVGESLDDDLKNAGALARAVGAGRNLFNVERYYDEIKRELLLELDYRRELLLLEEYRGYLAPYPDLVVPRAYPELSSDKVLVLERLHGRTLTQGLAEVDTLLPADRFRIAVQLETAIYAPFLRNGVMHGDAHPGNFLLLDGGRLGVLDFGSVKHFSRAFWECYREAVAAGLRGQHPDLFTLVKRGGFAISLDETRARALLDEIAHIVGKPLHGPYDWASDTMVAELKQLKLKRATELLRVRPPPEALLFFRAVAGLAHNLRGLKADGDLRPLFVELLAGEVALHKSA